MEHARHVFRILFLLFVAFVVVVLVRPLVVPKSYGLYGPYRYDNVAEQASARPPLHGGAASCGDCHGERLAGLAKGAHKTVNCEVCHAPLGRHVQDGSLVAAMPVDRAAGPCLRCHRKLEGRPAGFPQIVPAQHADNATQGRACLACHDPHSPKP
jgi:hypothetical protein